MGYERKSLQIVGGTLNLLPPVDKIPSQDYLLAQNWRVDRDGKLVSRYGYPQKFTLAGAGVAHSAAVFGGVEGDLYVACNNGNGVNPCTVYWNPVSGSTAIVSGLSGGRVGMVPMNGWMWIMDPAVQRKYSPSGGSQNYGLAAPANALTAAAGSADATGPSGVYQFYVTYETPDQSVESNPSPVSNSVTLTNQDAIFTGIPVSPDPQVGIRNIYATGGTLGQPYLIGTINDNATTTAYFNVADANGGAFLQAWSDLSATDLGQVMPTTNDPPPAAAGMTGPYFSRLFAWNASGNSNRLYWTDPDTPQYWPGAANPAAGNWADVGLDGEAIVWCTMHTNVLVIYKERSIWRLVGDPDTGYLERVSDEVGLASAFGVAEAGQVDYFVAPNGLYRFNLDSAQDMTDPIRPLFDASGTNAGAQTRPGAILPSSSWFSNSLYCYAVSVGYAMGKLYISYAEQSTVAGASVMLVYSEAKRRWAYHRNSLGLSGFQGFYFDGVEMVGLSGNGSAAVGFNLDDFRAFYSQDPGPYAIECVYQSHYEDGGLPDNQKVWIEVVIDYELQGDTASVLVGLNNGAIALTAVGTVTGSGRQSTGFPLAFTSAGALTVANPDDDTQTPALAKNISVAFDCVANNPVIVHNVYLYYYEEARLAQSASTLPTDLGAANVKQVKEIELDIDASGGPVTANLYSDLPGNALALRTSQAVAQSAGRALLKLPFGFAEGYLWKLALTALGAPFRVYGARLLARIVGVYVEAYEAAAGFVWDSMELTFDSGITHIPRGYSIALAALPIKRFREITFEIETFNGNVLMSFLTDLPGDAQAVRWTQVINTGTAGRRFVRVPLPGGTLAPIEGRLCRIQLSGASKFILYAAAVEVLAVGVYIEAYEASAGAVYDSREQDFSTPAVKEARELELDIETTGAVTAQMLSDISAVYAGTANTSGRQKVMIPLTVNAGASQFVEGRLLRLILSGTSAVRLYGARVLIRAFGVYLQASETSAGALWDSTELDLGTQQVKQLRELELEIWAYGNYTVAVYTDLPGNAMTLKVNVTLGATVGRTKVQVPLPQGSVPDNYIFGRLVRATIASSSSFKLFGARIHARAIGVYVESYEAAGNDGYAAVWDSTPSDLGTPNDKMFDQARFEMDSDGAAWVTVYTDLPGETFTSKGTYALTSGPTSRHWATAPLPALPEGRSIRLVVGGNAGFRIYKAQVRAFETGRYLCAATPSGPDALATLEFDFRSERVKTYKWAEIDMRADQTVQLAALTNQTGQMAQQYGAALSTTNGRQTLRIVFPPGIRGRLLRLALTGGPARIYFVRVWQRPLNEPGAAWEWAEYPIEESDVLPKWSDLAVEPTAPNFAWADLPVAPTATEWQWASFPVNPTEAQWFWAKVLSVDETSEKWEWVNVPGLTQ